MNVDIGKKNFDKLVYIYKLILIDKKPNFITSFLFFFSVLNA